MVRYKSTKDNIDNEKYGKKRSWYSNTSSDLKQWSLRPDAYEIEQFLTDRDIPERRYYEAVEQNDEMKEAHIFAKTRIGLNRQKIAIEKNLGINSAVAFTLPRYLKSWRDELEWRSKLKNEEDKNSGTKIVVIEKFEDKKDE